MKWGGTPRGFSVYAVVLTFTEQKRAAADHLFEHGRRPARTTRALGYPSRQLLAAWIDELEPGRRPKHPSARQVSREIEEQAVIDLVTRRGAVKDIANELGAEGAALRNRKRRLLDKGGPRKLPKETAEASRELEEYAGRTPSSDLMEPSCRRRSSAESWRKDSSPSASSALAKARSAMRPKT